MSCNCSNTLCTNGTKCTPDKYTSELIFDGLKSLCPELAGIKPNCTNLNDILSILADNLCIALNNNGLDGAGYAATSINSEDLDGAFTSRSITITPIITPTSTGTAYQIGSRVRMTSLANPIDDYMEGVVTAFNNITGLMTLLIDHFGSSASGIHIDWLVNVVGDVGDASTTPGPVGPPGPPGGIGGGMAFEKYISNNPDYVWTAVDTAVPGMTHNVGADGNYQVFLSSNSQLGASAQGSVQLHINGSLVVAISISAPLESHGDEVMKHTSINWRGSLLAGETIEMKVISTTAFSVVTQDTTLLINKES